MKIKQKFQHVTGEFDTDTMKMVCVKSPKYQSVDLCFQDGMNYPIAVIKLYDRDSWQDVEACFEDAGKLGDEIARRWNLHIPTKKAQTVEQRTRETCASKDNCQQSTYYCERCHDWKRIVPVTGGQSERG